MKLTAINRMDLTPSPATQTHDGIDHGPLRRIKTAGGIFSIQPAKKTPDVPGSKAEIIAFRRPERHQDDPSDYFAYYDMLRSIGKRIVRPR